MDTENLIWIFIFGIYILSVIAKRLRASAKPKDSVPSPRPSGLRKKFEDWLDKIRQELEAASQKPSSGPTGWDQVAPSQDDWIDEEPEPAAVAAPPSPKKIMARKSKLSVRQEPPQAPSSVSVKRGVDDFSSLEVQDLRRAVIWSEILGPPLALRERKGFFN